MDELGGAGDRPSTNEAARGRVAPPDASRISTVAIRVWRALRRDYLLQVLLVAAAVLTLVQPVKLGHLPTLVDWPTIAALAGLLALTKGVELSGFFHRVGFHLITLEHTERKLAFFLVASSALLATVLTNDIALFIVVPLTLSL